MAEVTISDETTLVGGKWWLVDFCRIPSWFNHKSQFRPAGFIRRKTIKQRFEEFKNSNIQSILNSVRWSNFMASTACFFFLIFTFFSKVLSLDISGTIISGFCVIFTGILSLYELHMKRLNRTIRKNFGFLFTYIGRAAYVFLYPWFVMFTVVFQQFCSPFGIYLLLLWQSSSSF